MSDNETNSQAPAVPQQDEKSGAPLTSQWTHQGVIRFVEDESVPAGAIGLFSKGQKVDLQVISGKLTQADVESLAVHYATNGVEVDELHLNKAMLDDYNEAVGFKERVVLSAAEPGAQAQAQADQSQPPVSPEELEAAAQRAAANFGSAPTPLDIAEAAAQQLTEIIADNVPPDAPADVATEDSIFDCKAQVLILDSEGLRALETFVGKVGSIQLKSPVLVRAAGKEIGAASIYVEDALTVVADIKLTKASPERLDIETGSSPVHALPAFSKLEDPVPGQTPSYQRDLVALDLVTTGPIDNRVAAVQKK